MVIRRNDSTILRRRSVGLLGRFIGVSGRRGPVESLINAIGYEIQSPQVVLHPAKKLAGLAFSRTATRSKSAAWWRASPPDGAACATNDPNLRCTAFSEVPWIRFRFCRPYGTRFYFTLTQGLSPGLSYFSPLGLSCVMRTL